MRTSQKLNKYHDRRTNKLYHAFKPKLAEHEMNEVFMVKDYSCYSHCSLPDISDSILSLYDVLVRLTAEIRIVLRRLS